MKIAHVVVSMEMGGAETLVREMCRLQQQQGHEPCVYAIGKLGVLGEQMLREGFAVQSNIGLHLLDSARSFFRIFRGSRPDVVHAHNPMPTIYAAMAARMAGVPSIVSTRHSLEAPPRKKHVELKYAIAATCCDWVAGICDATVKNLKSIHNVLPSKIVRVYNGAESLKLVPKENWPSKTGFTLVYVGRLVPVKNHSLLLNAFRVALTSRSDLRLWMVGDGSERKALESLAGELGISTQVTFWGQQLDVSPYFSAADAFIMSSKSEGLPVSLLQAFSLGLPAIVTDVGGMAEGVRLARAGHIVSATDPAKMAAAILSLAQSDVERKQFSQNAEEAFRSSFTISKMVDAYMGLYQNTPRARGQRTHLDLSPFWAEPVETRSSANGE